MEHNKALNAALSSGNEHSELDSKVDLDRHLMSQTYSEDSRSRYIHTGNLCSV